MKQVLSLLLSMTLVSGLHAQRDLKEVSDSLVTEASILYRSEMASWYGTDLYLEKNPERRNLGGYFSYSINDHSFCVFFSDSLPVKVMGTVTFDTTYDVNTARVDLKERELTAPERAFFDIRQAALKTINSDTLFKSYKNTNLNLIPVISNGQKKVYVLTGPSINGVVIFGNDYLLTYDQNNQLTSKKMLHRNIIVLEFNDGKIGKEEVSAVHAHKGETSEFITVTDLCTLMLYARFTSWEQHFVISDTYVSIWDCIKKDLFIMTRDAWDKIYKSAKDGQN